MLVGFVRMTVALRLSFHPCSAVDVDDGELEEDNEDLAAEVFLPRATI